MTTPPDLSLRETYTVWTSEKLRFGDTDMVGHINNSAFAVLIENSRAAFTFDLLRDRAARNLLMVVARIEIDYRAELHWPGEVDIGTKLLGLGTTSFRLGNGVFRGAICAATAIATLVMIDGTTRRPVPIPADFRALLASL